jgi:chromosome segregation ATPase
MDNGQRIEQAKANIRKAETVKITAETQQKAAEEQMADIAKQMEAEGVSPDTINEEIEKLESQITEQLTEVEKLIPAV